MGFLARRVMGELYVESRVLLRYKSSLFWVVVFPMLFLSLMAVIFAGGGPEAFTIAVTNLDPSSGDSWLSHALVEALNATAVFELRLVGDPQEAWEMVTNATVDVALLIPDNFTESVQEMLPAIVTIVAREEQPGMPNPAAQALRGALGGFAEEIRERAVEVALQYVPPGIREHARKELVFIASPLHDVVEVVKPPLLYTRGGVVAYYTINVIGIQVLFIGLSMGSVMQIERKHDGSLKMLLASPQTPLGLFVTDLAVLFFYTAVSMAAVLLAGLVWGASYTMLDGVSWAGIIFLTMASALFSNSLGLILALRTRTVEGASMIMNSIAFPTMFLGGLTVPKELLPHWVQFFAEVFPHTRLIDSMRSIVVYGASVTDALLQAMPALAATLVLVVGGWLAYRRLLQSAVEAL